jgi:hypothetical protein
VASQATLAAVQRQASVAFCRERIQNFGDRIRLLLAN